MTQVNFYVMNAQEDADRERFGCRLVEKAYKLGHKVYVHAENSEQADKLDQLLWTFRAGSFVPHVRANQGDDAESIVIVGDKTDRDCPDADVLINLAQSAPDFFRNFEKVAEIVGTSESEKEQGRARYRFYREQGCPLTSHEV